jgi:hypothetical protein
VNKVYSYRVEVYDVSGVLLTTATDSAMRTASLADDPIWPGTAVQAQHIQELIAAINGFRSAAGLTPVAVADAVRGQRIRATHIAQLRESLNQARTILGLPTIAFPADAAAGSRIRARHIEELREALR